MSKRSSASTPCLAENSQPNLKLPKWCTSLCKVKEIRLEDANVIMAQAHRDGSVSLSRIPRFAKRSSDLSGSTTPTPREMNVATPSSQRRTNNNGREIRKYGSHSYGSKTTDISSYSKRKPTYSDITPSGGSPLHRRRASVGSDGYCSSSTTPVNADRYGMTTPRQRNHTFNGDANTMLRDNFVKYTPQIRTSPISDPGRVQVFVRIRPLTDGESSRGEKVAVTPEELETTQLKILDGKNERKYQFDGVLPVDSTNKQVFQSVGQPLVRSALSGFNGILMCYGQTGTGKTFTLMSPEGMSVRVVYKCFKIINKDVRHKYTVTCSYLQIYQEKIYDLLNTNRTVNLSLRQHPKEGVYVENLTEYVVHSPREVLNLLRVGRKRLVFAETQMNRASSRSHAICQLKILKEKNRVDLRSETPRTESAAGWNTPQADFYFDDEMDNDNDPFLEQNSLHTTLMNDDEDEDDDCLSHLTELDDNVTSVKGKIYLCDLAGSERIKRTKAQGERLQEAQHINSSLLELGNVIQALAEGNRGHVPFRNSTLTRLLQEGLSGNCKTKLVVCVSPALRDVHETKCSLNFGSRAMKVQVTAQVNYEVDYKKLAECLSSKLELLEEEWNMKRADLESVIAILKAELAARRPASSADGFMFSPISQTFDNSPVRKHGQALLILELMTLQMFYSCQENREKFLNNESDRGLTSMFTHENEAVCMDGLEKLTEVLLDCLRSSVSGCQSSQSSTTSSSVFISPDCIEDTDPSDSFDALDPLIRYLATVKGVSLKSKDEAGHQPLTCEERASHLLDHLSRLKKTIAHAAVGFVKDVVLSDQDTSSANTIEEVLAAIGSPSNLSLDTGVEEHHKKHLEHALYFLLMDKALLACVMLLQSTTAQPKSHSEVETVKRLALERKERLKISNELAHVKEERQLSEQKLRHLENELGLVIESKAKVESKLNELGKKNSHLEKTVTDCRNERDQLEKKVAEINRRRQHLEHAIKATENNNAKKERAIVDLKNQKVALDSIMVTLKEELSTLEKEKKKDHEDRKNLEVELEEVKDRNIILETEWSCCREENGLLETELIALEDDKAMLEEELNRYKDDVQMLEEALNVLEQQTTTYKIEVQTLKQKEDKLLSNIRLEKEKVARDLTVLKQEMASLKGEKRKFQRDISLSRADKSNTERAYTALKNQNDSLKTELTGVKQTERKLLKEITMLKNDKSRLEREVASLRSENTKLKADLVAADNLKTEVKLLKKNEEKITLSFKEEQEMLQTELHCTKEKFAVLEVELKRVEDEKDRLLKDLRRFEKAACSLKDNCDLTESQSAIFKKDNNDVVAKDCDSEKQHQSHSVGDVTHVESKLLDLQRRLAFFMTEKDEIQKNLTESRERNSELVDELNHLQEDASNIQTVLSTLSDEKTSIEAKLKCCEENQTLLASERNRLELQMSRSEQQKKAIQNELSNVLEINHNLEADKKILKESIAKLNCESCIFSVENKHCTGEVGRLRNQIKDLNTNLSSISNELNQTKTSLEKTQEHNDTLNKQLKSKHSENSMLRRELESYKNDEIELTSQLSELSSKFRLVDINLQRLVAEKNELLSESAIEKLDVTRHAELQAVEKERLEQEVGQLKSKIIALTDNLFKLKQEREEMEVAFKETIAMTEGGEAKLSAFMNASNDTLLRFVNELKEELASLVSEKKRLQTKLVSVEEELSVIVSEKNEIKSNLSLETSRYDQEKVEHRTHISQLYKQLENSLKEKKQLEGEVDFIKQQNTELRAEVAIIMDENDKLEGEIDELEKDYEKQETELETSAEETKQLLRQLCSVETKNLQLNTVQSSIQDEKDHLLEINMKLENERMDIDEERLTYRDRMLVAELEVARLKSECEILIRQRNVLMTELKFAKQNRDNVSHELHDLARALSPLKAEVISAIQGNTVSKTDGETSESSSIGMTVSRGGSEEILNEVRSDEGEEAKLEQYLTKAKRIQEDLKQRMVAVIDTLDEQAMSRDSQSETKGIKDLVRGLTAIEKDKNELDEELNDIILNNSFLSIEVENLRKELISAQENMSLAIMERLQLSNQVRQLGSEMKAVRSASGQKSATGIDNLQSEVEQISDLIKDFQHVGNDVTSIIKRISDQLQSAENSLKDIELFKSVIESNLKQYKQRNIYLESQLRLVFAELTEMSKHDKRGSEITKTTLVMMEAASLQKQSSLMESEMSHVENENQRLIEASKDLVERCGDLTDEQDITCQTQAHLQECLTSQRRKIEQLEKESEAIASDRDKLKRKVIVYREDKKRILEDFARLNTSLSSYARYNNELEKKLEAFKEDVGRLEETAIGVKREVENSSQSDETDDSRCKEGGLLCAKCRRILHEKFSGTSKGTKVLGNELFDCIEDNLAMETAILSFMDQRAHLEKEMSVIDTDRKCLEDIMANTRFISDRGLSASQSFVDCDWTASFPSPDKSAWSSGVLSLPRSKSMTSKSGDSLLDGQLYDVSNTQLRSHTALGICQSSASSSLSFLTNNDELVSGFGSLGSSSVSVNPPQRMLSSTSPVFDQPSTDVSITSSTPWSEQRPQMFQTVHEENVSGNINSRVHDRHHSKSKHLTGFLRKFRSSKRKRNFDNNSTSTL